MRSQIWPIWPHFRLAGLEEKIPAFGLIQDNPAFSGLKQQIQENLASICFFPALFQLMSIPCEIARAIASLMPIAY